MNRSLFLDERGGKGRGNPGLAEYMGEKGGWTDSAKMKYSI